MGDDTSSLHDKLALLETRLKALEDLLRSAKPATLSPSPPDRAPATSPASTAPPVQVSLVGKTFHKADYSRGDGGDRIDFKLTFKSNLDKDIRAIRGALVFSDLFEAEIMRVTLTDETGIPARGTAEWAGGIGYNQFLPPHQRLLGIAPHDMSVAFEAESIIYSDGTREKLPTKSTTATP